MSQGWVLNWRKIKDWEWYKTPNMAHLFQHLIREANHENGRWQGIILQKGQLVTSYAHLSQQTGLSVKAVRNCINHLKSTSEVAYHSTSRYSVLTICKYSDYQTKLYQTGKPMGKPMGSQGASRGQAEGKQGATNNNEQQCNNDNNEKQLNYCQTSEEVRLSELLLSLILERKPDFKKPNLQQWAKHIDWMIRLDRHALAQIEVIIRWCQADGFWQNNILSTEKLRKQFDQLDLKSKGVKQNVREDRSFSRTSAVGGTVEM